MTDKLRVRIAAAVTALFLAAVSAAGVIAHNRPPSAAPVTVSRPVSRGQLSGPSQPNAPRAGHGPEHD